MQRYFVDPDAVKGNSITITGDDVKHIGKVMRMSSGDKVICCDSTGRSALCEIEEVSKEDVTCTVVEWMDENTELPVNVTIVQGLPKSDKLELVVQKGTELGASCFYPFKAARSVVKWDRSKSEKKLDRLRKIAKEAAEQSHRTAIPEVEAPLSLQEVIDMEPEYDLKLVAYEEEAKQGESSNLSQALHQANRGQRVLLVIGPEGGLTEEEISDLTDAGFLLCGLGPRILRTETAALYFLAAVSYHFELMR
ncbi:16S rRNA (uracil(1498)-N(3))-methyltransferase [Pseudalkalibacillus caeni]|uniref:Ribosomal RNA small subunit methyltransferase E n=1 Tax=Exobacillus caeni TaxID=2574798 RepID=A0A5R9F6H9_9BACL|nr:16S rRNA (uracil(1498)-N(3))-methyltransferase [Pseudalkalibacillus caeni]TLS39352.1 16S rRNA (uracil(1498)-N(3))-methyltransferase [Pseudalkalibacillus caeni]